MRHVPLLKSLRFRFMSGFVALLLIGMGASALTSMYTAERGFQSLTHHQFKVTLSTVENFIRFAAQSAIMWGQHLTKDRKLIDAFGSDDQARMEAVLNTHADETNADVVTLLDSEGRVAASSVPWHPRGRSYRSLAVVRQSLHENRSGFSVYEEMGRYLIYASVPFEVGAGAGRRIGAILVGFIISDQFLLEIKRDTDVDISIVRDRAVLATTMLSGGGRMNDLPIPYLQYQLLLNNDNQSLTAEIDNVQYQLIGRPLGLLEAGAVGSILLAHSREELALIEREVTQRILIFSCVGLGMVLLIGWPFSQALLVPINKLTEKSRQVAAGESHERIALMTGNEYEVLADHFNLMLDAIELKNRQLEERNLNLAQEIEERREAEQAMAEAKRYAEAAAKAKSAFLANMSHEIRTPMNAVLGLARMTLRDSKESETRERIGQVLASGRHLMGIINDILDISKLEAGKINIEARSFPLVSTLEEIRDLVEEEARVKSLKLSCRIADNCPEWVKGDALRLRQILFNLINNAVKFTDQGEIRICIAGEGETIYFQVSDTGIGMSAEQCSRLFTSFGQGDSSTTRRYGGTGLGLAISRDLAQLMGGDITVVSRAGEGSNFILRLPLPETAPGTWRKDRHSLPAQPRLVGLSILAAEDVEANRIILEDILNQEGAELVFAENGRQALERMEAPAAPIFDLVLMDIQMPEMDGYEATRRILERCPLIPIIGLTAHALVEERQRCLAAGMVDHVSKPIDVENLVTTILRHVSSAETDGTEAILETQTPVTAASNNAKIEDSLIDWEALSARFNNRTAFVEKLLHSVLKSYSETPALLRRAAEERNLETLAYLAHGLKGTSGSLEARLVNKHARQTEESARSGQDDAPHLAIDLAVLTERLMGELQSKLSSGLERSGQRTVVSNSLDP
jgi:signal transduction histidine kinase/CheY-like chemotaxis protein/HPt (histidine-containing phosphotransfer) domain-containing protein